MGSDAISNARVSAINNKSANKNRGSKLGKLKPNKVEFRTEHGLSQGNKKEHNGKNQKAGGERPPSIPPKSRKGNRTQGGNQLISTGKHEHGTILPITYNNEAVSWANGSVVRRSDRDGLSKDFYGNRVNSCNVSCSSSFSEDDGCLDDWEAMADALNAENNRQHTNVEHHNSKPEASTEHCRYQASNRAWSPDDAYRPRSLPRISKQQYNNNQSQLNSERRGNAAFSWQTVGPRQQQHQKQHYWQQQKQHYWQQQKQHYWQQQQQPSACPICCEDFDVTDSSFQPCPCGFRLCLFCHKKILEVDSRCPGCRKQYGSVNADVDLSLQTTSCTKNSWV